MRSSAPFQAADLEHLDRLLDRATAVVPMIDIYYGADDPRIIGLRHDVDNTIEEAVEFAHWEWERGYRASYYVLHNAPYWADKERLQKSLHLIAGFGHEIGIHNSALSDAAVTGEDPGFELAAALVELHGYGYTVHGTVAHGAPDCYDTAGRVRVVNDEMFVECARPELGPPDRVVGEVKIEPRSLTQFGLLYDANWLERGAYLSDSGGRWSLPGFEIIEHTFPPPGQLHLLVHPCHWTGAFREVAV